MRSEVLLILLIPLLYAKPAPHSMASPSPIPWDWQINSSRKKFNFYQEKMEDLLKKPYFAKVNNRTKVHVGETTFLPCRIKDLGEQYTVRQILDICFLEYTCQVSWMRLSDMTVLTVDSSTFSSDERYRVVHINR